MSDRRVPSGGLAALAVVLAALAVLVVAGAHERVVRTVVRLAAAPSPAHVTEPTPAHGGSGAGRPAAQDTSSSTGVVPSSTVTTLEALGAPTTTTTAPPTSPTTTIAPPATTTTVLAPSSLTGWFPGGGSPVAEQLGPVTEVTVTVPPGVDVSLDVTCGLAHEHVTSVSAASVRLEGGGASCVAQFSVPAATPRPARWRLAAT